MEDMEETDDTSSKTWSPQVFLAAADAKESIYLWSLPRLRPGSFHFAVPCLSFDPLAIMTTPNISILSLEFGEILIKKTQAKMNRSYRQVL